MCDEMKDQHESCGTPASPLREEHVRDPGRRKAILDGLFGAGWLGLRALATGVPVALLANPRRALA
ncbi:MAG: hypothetical protein JWM82_4069, partial [Myxococcales bacterium]|nr:hypothetical protein [Myxococcales bacterium]